MGKGMNRSIRYASTASRPMRYFLSRVTPPLGELAFLRKLAPPASYIKAQLDSVVAKDVAEVSDVEILPAEGGALVSFDAFDSTKLSAIMAKGFKRSRYFPLFLLRPRVHGFEVRGEPWITDIPHKLSRTISISPEIPEESVYSLLRPYGRLAHCTSKSATFIHKNDACAAIVCAHRSPAPSSQSVPSDSQTRPSNSHLNAVNTAPAVNAVPPVMPVIIRLSPSVGPNFVHKCWQWLTGHPRVSLPVLLALVLTLAYHVFEPVRQLGVETKIAGKFQEYVKWATNKTTKLLDFAWTSSESRETISISETMNLQVEDLKKQLNEGSMTFTVVSGPKGSGKSLVLDSALSQIPQPRLVIDLRTLRNGDTEAMFAGLDSSFNAQNPANTAPDTYTLRQLAKAVGYWPLFMWTESVLKACELGITSVTGQTTKLTRSFDEQAADILATVTTVLRKLALKPMGKHTVEEEALYLNMHPETRPVVVIEGFTSNDDLSRLLARWGGQLVRQNIAKVVFSTNDGSYEKSLALALPNKVFKSVVLSDASPALSKQYVYDQFKPLAESKAAELAFEQLKHTNTEFLSPLGGRMTDLQAYGRRLLSGETPELALSSLIRAAAVEVAQLFLTPNKNWTTPQTWTVIAKVSEGKNWLNVQGQLLGKLGFKTEVELQQVLELLKEADLISTRTSGGRIIGIKPSKPLYMYAFKELVADPMLRPLMNAKLARAQIEAQQALISTYEKEMQLLSPLVPMNLPREVRDRLAYLATKLGVSQQLIEQSEKQYAVSTNELSLVQV